ncbi:hypothetical protein ACIFQM_02895 [Paenibacillus sp. NRS-1782]|uniref:hypothetical protein n=1 Tax=unclassified Paenibacillus TaxID=185978 RepID=UPI003D2674D5
MICDQVVIIRFVGRLYGAEDFAYYLERRPGAFIHVGARNEDERTHYAQHLPHFDFDERALLVSGHIFLVLALE